MRSVKSLVAAGAATLLSLGGVRCRHGDRAAADYAPPPVVEDFGGWYLRGDIGFSNQRVNRLNNALMPTPPRRCSSNQLRHRGHLRPRRRLPGSTTGSALTSPVNIAATRSSSAPTRHHLSPAASAPTTITPSSPNGCSGQRLCRSRHLVVHHAVHRRRRRRRADHDQHFTDQGIAINGVGRVPGLAYGDSIASGISPGRCMPVSPTRSRRTSPSNWPIATSIWAMA